MKKGFFDKIPPHLHQANDSSNGKGKGKGFWNERAPVYKVVSHLNGHSSFAWIGLGLKLGVKGLGLGLGLGLRVRVKG
jgi:hypothetical protein